jgi:signal transduction histidine kinase
MAVLGWLRLLLLVLLAGLAPVGGVAAESPRILEPTSGFRISSDSEQPPPTDAAWIAVKLPENRGGARLTSKPAALWYRIEFDAPHDPMARESWAVYVPYLLDGGHFYLNGEPLAQLAEPSAEVHVKWERPHLLPVPATAIQPGRNLLHVRTQPTPASISLEFPRIAFGPAAELSVIYEFRLFWIRVVPQLTSTFCFIVGFYVLFIWLRRRSEVLYGLFGLMIIAWGVRTMTFVIEVLPAGEWLVWRFFFLSASGVFATVIAVFMLRFAQLRLKWLEWALLLYCLIGPVVFILSAGAADGWVDKVWRTAGWMVVQVILLGATLLAAWRQRSLAACAMLAGALVVIGSAAHDIALYMGALEKWIPDWAGHRIFLLHHGANVMLLVMGGILALRFIEALVDLESLNRNLEQRVADREAQLEAHFEHAQTLERERATVEERRRIMEDMHDGLGSQLIQSLLRAQRGNLKQHEMADTLSACIDEMRLALEALGSSEDRFLDAIADFRFRWERQLDAAGVRSTWRIEAADEALKFTPRTTLQYLRIIQEALTNILKHARATLVQVQIVGEGDALRIHIEDDGIGMDGAGNDAGHGLRNMRRRADLLGATLKIDSAPGGTCVEVRVPLTAETA